MFGIKEAHFIFQNECVCFSVYVFICFIILSLPLFSCVSLTMPLVAVCLKVWLSAFYRLDHLNWYHIGGEWVGEREMAHVGA